MSVWSRGGGRALSEQLRSNANTNVTAAAETPKVKLIQSTQTLSSTAADLPASVSSLLSSLSPSATSAFTSSSLASATSSSSPLSNNNLQSPSPSTTASSSAAEDGAHYKPRVLSLNQSDIILIALRLVTSNNEMLLIDDLKYSKFSSNDVPVTSKELISSTADSELAKYYWPSEVVTAESSIERSARDSFNKVRRSLSKLFQVSFEDVEEELYCCSLEHVPFLHRNWLRFTFTNSKPIDIVSPLSHAVPLRFLHLDSLKEKQATLENEDFLQVCDDDYHLTPSNSFTRHLKTLRITSRSSSSLSASSPKLHPNTLSIAAVLYTPSHVLLMQNAQQDTLTWGLPSTHVDQGESVIFTLNRLVRAYFGMTTKSFASLRLIKLQENDQSGTKGLKLDLSLLFDDQILIDENFRPTYEIDMPSTPGKMFKSIRPCKWFNALELGELINSNGIEKMEGEMLLDWIDRVSNAHQHFLDAESERKKNNVAPPASVKTDDESGSEDALDIDALPKVFQYGARVIIPPTEGFKQ